MPPGLDHLRADVRQYYDRRLSRYGATPLGVDWDCALTQELRFVQLAKRMDLTRPFLLNDLGCGYGALFGFLAGRCRPGVFDYAGVDLSASMIRKASERWGGNARTAFSVGSRCPRVADHSVASGIFNVKLGCADELWAELVADTLTGLHTASRLAFAVNFKLDLRAPDRTGGGLYRTRPEIWASFCEDRLAAKVVVVDDYGLDEFTLIVSSNRAWADCSSFS